MIAPFCRAGPRPEAAVGRETRERKAPKPFVAESSDEFNRRVAAERDAAGLPPLRAPAKPAASPAAPTVKQEFPTRPLTIPPARVPITAGPTFKVELTYNMVVKATLSVPAELMEACRARDNGTPCQLELPDGRRLDSTLRRREVDGGPVWRAGTITMGFSEVLREMKLSEGDELHVRVVKRGSSVRLYLSVDGDGGADQAGAEGAAEPADIAAARAAAAAEAAVAAAAPGWFTLPPVMLTAASGASLRIPRGILQHWEVAAGSADCVMILLDGSTLLTTIKVDESTGEYGLPSVMGVPTQINQCQCRLQHSFSVSCQSTGEDVGLDIPLIGIKAVSTCF